MHIQTTSNRKEMFLDELIRKYEMLRELSVILVNSVTAAQRAHRSLTCRFELTATPSFTSHSMYTKSMSWNIAILLVPGHAWELSHS
jgi:hypothetical protein